MSAEFTVLGSGSRGNASLVRSGGSGVLIDLGLGSRDLMARLDEVGWSWGRVASALLTHTHGDHVRGSTLRALANHKIPLYCHEGHRRTLEARHGFAALEKAGCVRHFDDRPFLTPDGLRVEPIELSHDGGPTYGFRVEAAPARRGRPVSVGYLADTGCWRTRTADHLAGVNLLAVEFNHDVEMQRRSGRAPYLIARNLGDRGHLSNDQAAGLVAAVMQRSESTSLRHVVLLHLSEQCNRPGLALQVARAAIRDVGGSARAHAASQRSPFPHLHLSASRRRAAVPTGFPWEHASPPAEDLPFRLTAE